MQNVATYTVTSDAWGWGHTGQSQGEDEGQEQIFDKLVNRTLHHIAGIQSCPHYHRSQKAVQSCLTTAVIQTPANFIARTYIIEAPCDLQIHKNDKI